LLHYASFVKRETDRIRVKKVPAILAYRNESLEIADNCQEMMTSREHGNRDME
jgi:hypothetical protein